MNIAKNLALISSLVLALTVGLGAFGAHALKTRVSEYYLQVWEKAVFYQFTHVLAAFFLAFWIMQKPELGKLIFVVLGLLVSTLIFSGSLYVLVLTGIKWLGAITPIGGLGFIISWMLLFYFIWDQK